MIPVHSHTCNSRNDSRATRSMCYDGCSPPGGDGNNLSSSRNGEADDKDSWNRTIGSGSRDITSERPSGGVASTNRLWSSGKTELNVHFLDGTKRQKELVRNVVNEHYLRIPMNLKICFVKDDTYHGSDIRITFQTTCSESYIGREAEKHRGHPTMWLDLRSSGRTRQQSRLDIQATILHEFGHAFGLQHEHQHRHYQAVWNYKVLEHKHGWDPATVSKNYDKLGSTGIQYDAYDPDSIMHYPIELRDTCNGMPPVFQNSVLSEGDEELLMDLYPLPGY